MKSFRIILLLFFFFSLQSCGEGDDNFISVYIEKNDTNSNDDNNNDGDNGDNNNSDSSATNGILTSSKALLFINKISSDGIAHQSAACYGDYAFFFSNKMINVRVFNMRTNTRIFDFRNQTPLGTGTIYHCNQACFGTQKYNEEDYFPLLYISQFQNKSNRCFIQVFRVLPTSSGINQDFTAFAFDLVQTIYFPVFTDDNCLYCINSVIDTNYHYIYTYSYDQNSAAETFQQCKISKFSIPNALEEKTVYLSDSDILDSYFIATEGPCMQGGAYHDGLLYIGKGAPAIGYVTLHVIDLYNRKIWYNVDLLNNGFNWEPEGAFFYKDDLYIGASSRIFKFTFKYENSYAKAITVPLEMPE